MVKMLSEMEIGSTVDVAPEGDEERRCFGCHGGDGLSERRVCGVAFRFAATSVLTVKSDAAEGLEEGDGCGVVRFGLLC